MQNEKKSIVITLALLFLLPAAAVVISAAVVLRIPGMDRQINAAVSGAEYLGKDSVIFQMQKNDCGPAALAMLLNSVGEPIRRDEILRKIVMSENGTTMDELRKLSASRGVMLEGWKLDLRELSGRRMPALLFVKKQHFIIVDSLVRGEVFYRDPAAGRLKMTEDRFHSIWDGAALIIQQD